LEERPGLAALAHRKNLPEQSFGFLAIEEMRLVGRIFVGVRNKAVYFALGVQADSPGSPTELDFCDFSGV